MAMTVQAAVVLESGDRLTREEFRSRYEARPDIKKAELVQGVVYVALAGVPAALGMRL